jgi:endonuclease YncB( thermonuclease family)
MKKVLIIVAVLAIAGGAAAAFVPGSPFAKSEPKEASLPKNFGAYVLNVADGRTMAISVSNDLYTFRVKGIALPTRADAAQESEMSLRMLAFGRNILVENATKAADGVYEGDARVGPDHIAEAQVSAGLATPTTNDANLLSLRDTAKNGKLGMWAPAEPADSPTTPVAEQTHSASTL